MQYTPLSLEGGHLRAMLWSNCVKAASLDLSLPAGKASRETVKAQQLIRMMTFMTNTVLASLGLPKSIITICFPRQGQMEPWGGKYILKCKICRNTNVLRHMVTDLIKYNEWQVTKDACAPRIGHKRAPFHQSLPHHRPSI